MKYKIKFHILNDYEVDVYANSIDEASKRVFNDYHSGFIGTGRITNREFVVDDVRKVEPCKRKRK